MTEQKFLYEYKKLNDEQKTAVDAIEGPVMVVAGPGTGKTQILTLRIANILRQTDTPPDAILALTFTESGVFSMKNRLKDIAGSAGYRVAIHTFHEFCNTIIQDHPDQFPRIIGASNINDVDTIHLLQELITGASFTWLKPFGDPYYYIPHIKRKIGELKREAVSPADVRAKIEEERAALSSIQQYHEKGAHKGKVRGEYAKAEKQIEKNEEFAYLYEQYEEKLAERRWYDYEDMIIEVIRALEANEELLRELQETYHYLLADEHQDANNSQNRLLELLASYYDHPNLFVVGDEKQAIFRFQGASLENFLYFQTRFPSVQIIQLKSNYRSTQTILDAAHSTISAGTKEGDERLAEVREKLRQPLKAAAQQDIAGSVRLASFEDPEREHMFVAREAKRLIEEGVAPQEIAVLYRINRDAEAVSAVFERERIPFAVESDQNILTDPDIDKLLKILTATYRIGEDEPLMAVLHIDFLGIAPLDIYRISRYSWKHKVPFYEIIKSPPTLKKAGVGDTEALHGIYRKLSSWNTLSYNRGLLEVFEKITHESGLMSSLITHTEAVEKLEKLHGLYRNAEALVENHREYTLADFLEYIRQLRQYNITVGKRSRPVTPRGVRLMTAHKSKGQEFDYVFIIGAYDGHWGSKKSTDHFPIAYTKTGDAAGSSTDDERRLFYVALTRARLQATITYPRTAESGKELLPCQFIGEIETTHITEENTELFEQTITPDQLMAPRERLAVPPIEDAEFLRNLFVEQGLSVTALNNYLKCPWQYFYSNLLRVPAAPNKHLMFGTAVHAALKYYVDILKTGEDIGKAGLLRAFEAELNRQPLSLSDHADALEKGKRALSGYFDERRRRFTAQVLTEFKVRILFETKTEEAPRIPLRGDLDKIELQGGNAVHVVDYKTGKPKSRNDIEGKTKHSNGEYKRQLVFYKLLLDYYDEGKYRMDSGEIDFVEPNERGKYISESFFITDEEVHELRQTITDAVRDIATLGFWDRRCDDKKCGFCPLRDMLR